MFEKFNTISKNSEIKKSKSFEELPVQKDIIAKNHYHASHTTLAKIATKYDLSSYNKVNKDSDLNFIENIKNVESSIKKGEEINKLIQASTVDSLVRHNFLLSKKAFKKALLHYCFYDIINENEAENKVTVAFLPISTSNNIVLCGSQKFDKVFVYSNGSKDFYITRLLFHKIMTKQQFYEWENNIKYKGDNDARQFIFNKIQKDLDQNSYSLLKESDLIEPNTEFFSKELPLVKFKFTDLDFNG